MSSMPVSLDRPPAPPSDVQNQMGAGGPDPRAGLLARIAQAVRDRAQQGNAPGSPAANMVGQPPPAAAPNPQGAILTQGQQVETLLTQMARTNDKFGPWATRITQLLRAGMGDVLGTPAPGQAQEPTGPDADGASSAASGSAKAPEGELNKGFAG